MKVFTLTLAVAAGFLGGVLSHWVSPQAVSAQAQTSKEIRAQSFVLEDSKGRTMGIFSVELPGPRDSVRGATGSIRLFDQRGREIWRTPRMGIVPASE